VRAQHDEKLRGNVVRSKRVDDYHNPPSSFPLTYILSLNGEDFKTRKKPPTVATRPPKIVPKAPYSLDKLRKSNHSVRSI